MTGSILQAEAKFIFVLFACCCFMQVFVHLYFDDTSKGYISCLLLSMCLMMRNTHVVIICLTVFFLDLFFYQWINWKTQRCSSYSRRVHAVHCCYLQVSGNRNENLIFHIFSLLFHVQNEWLGGPRNPQTQWNVVLFPEIGSHVHFHGI